MVVTCLGGGHAALAWRIFDTENYSTPIFKKTLKHWVRASETATLAIITLDRIGRGRIAVPWIEVRMATLF